MIKPVGLIKISAIYEKSKREGKFAKSIVLKTCERKGPKEDGKGKYVDVYA